MILRDAESVFYQDFCALVGVVAAGFVGWFLAHGLIVGAIVMSVACLASGVFYVLFGRGEEVEVDSD